MATLDAHPLVREHFAGELATTYKTSSVEAHRRLYEHLKQSAPELPDNLNDMLPLYHAVAHGCKAGLEQRALDDVYYAIIDQAGEGFAARKLGAFGADLSALSNFFVNVSWDAPINEISNNDRAYVLNRAGFALRGLGRLRDAAKPIQTRVEIAIKACDWKNAALNASNLSELTLGDVSSAVRQGEQSVELADRSGDAFQRMSKRTALAAALHAAGGRRGSDKVNGKALAAGADEEPAASRGFGGFVRFPIDTRG